MINIDVLMFLRILASYEAKIAKVWTSSLVFFGFAHCLLIIAQPHTELFKGASYVAIFRHVRRRMEMHTCS